jgi:hypothetical protein
MNPFFAKQNHVRLPKSSKTKPLINTDGDDATTDLLVFNGEAMVFNAELMTFNS